MNDWWSTQGSDTESPERAALPVTAEQHRRPAHFVPIIKHSDLATAPGTAYLRPGTLTGTVITPDRAAPAASPEPEPRVLIADAVKATGAGEPSKPKKPKAKKPRTRKRPKDKGGDACECCGAQACSCQSPIRGSHSPSSECCACCPSHPDHTAKDDQDADDIEADEVADKPKKAKGKAKGKGADEEELDKALSWRKRWKSALAYETAVYQARWYGSAAAAGIVANGAYVAEGALLYGALRVLRAGVPGLGGLTGLAARFVLPAGMAVAGYHLALHPVYGIGHFVALNRLPLVGSLGGEGIASLSEVYRELLTAATESYGTNTAVLFGCFVTGAAYGIAWRANRRGWPAPVRWICAIPYGTALVTTVITTL
ncbi:hypothetical protein ACIQCG_00690 [Streptomyces noursei]|uniref:hypothetical protein n=1 Tax=Streptomyces noursei TaxID=1971 RepID=UPI003800E134